MKTLPAVPTHDSETAARVLVRGVHLDLTPALHSAVLTKAARLFRHHHRLIRVRLDLAHEAEKGDRLCFVASGRVELSGPDLVAHVASEDMYKSIDLLVDRLDRMVRERTRSRANRRNDRPEGTEFRDRLAVA